MADEVRSLAQRTQESTEEIQNMISKLEAGTSKAVESMQRTAQASDSAVERASNAGVSLQKIQQIVTEMSDMNTQVATASEEQSSVAEEISRNVVRVADVAQRVLELAEENKHVYAYSFGKLLNFETPLSRAYPVGAHQAALRLS